MTVAADELHVLLDFDTAAEAELFSPIDDAVMGGVSSSRLVVEEPGIAVFSGNVSLENNGGFASVRSLPRDWGTAAAREFVLRVRGDGKRYRFNVRTPDGDEVQTMRPYCCWRMISQTALVHTAVPTR